MPCASRVIVVTPMPVQITMLRPSGAVRARAIAPDVSTIDSVKSPIHMERRVMPAGIRLRRAVVKRLLRRSAWPQKQKAPDTTSRAFPDIGVETGA